MLTVIIGPTQSAQQTDVNMIIETSEAGRDMEYGKIYACVKRLMLEKAERRGADGVRSET